MSFPFDSDVKQSPPPAPVTSAVFTPEVQARLDEEERQRRELVTMVFNQTRGPGATTPRGGGGGGDPAQLLQKLEEDKAVHRRIAVSKEIARLADYVLHVEQNMRAASAALSNLQHYDPYRLTLKKLQDARASMQQASRDLDALLESVSKKAEM